MCHQTTRRSSLSSFKFLFPLTKPCHRVEEEESVFYHKAHDRQLSFLAKGISSSKTTKNYFPPPSVPFFHVSSLQAADKAGENIFLETNQLQLPWKFNGSYKMIIPTTNSRGWIFFSPVKLFIKNFLLLSFTFPSQQWPVAAAAAKKTHSVGTQKKEGRERKRQRMEEKICLLFVIYTNRLPLVKKCALAENGKNGEKCNEFDVREIGLLTFYAVDFCLMI